MEQPETVVGAQGSGTRPASSTSQAPSGRRHTVRAGESLWQIAQQVLGSDASPAEIARYVRAIWRLNAERLGTAGPDLIQPGQTLALPARG